MLKYTILVLFLAGIKLGSCRPQKNAAEAREQITNDGIKKNQIVVNGPEDAAARNKEILNNFRNPVLEYLLNKNTLRNDLDDRKGVIRQIQHSQTLLIPNLMNGQNLFAGTILNLMGDLQTNHADDENVVKRDPEKTPIENFLNYVKNHETKTKEESSVSSPVLHLNKNQTEKTNVQDDLTRIKIYPAVAVLINTFSKDGMLKNSVTHYQPDFESMKNYVKEKEDLGTLLTQNQTINLEKNLNQIQKMHYSHHINNVSGNSQSQWSIEKEEKSQVHVDGETQETHEKHEEKVTTQDLGQLRQGGLNWPFAGYFPIVINDPFLTAYNAFTSSMYSAFSSMIEYGPEADICRSEKEHQAHKSLFPEGHQSHKNLVPEEPQIHKTLVPEEHETHKTLVPEEHQTHKTLVPDDLKREGSDEIKTEATETKNPTEEMENIEEMKVGTEVTLIMPEDEKKMEVADPEIFDEIRLEAAKLTSPNDEEEEEQAVVKEATERKLKDVDDRRSKRDTTNIFMKIKKGGMIDINVQEPDIKSDLLNLDAQERSRSHSIPVVHLPPLSTVVRPQFNGYFDKRKKPKPAKPGNKEENEETSEEVGEEQESSSESSGGDGVAISPPPEGSSVAEAKPVGLAIAGPGGVAAAKPQGTAVAGPGGLAIARPVGTAIAGVEVEGSIPIGAQKNKKKKPKQDPEKESQKEDDNDLQYVGGLTGPIGNPQPKEFSDGNFFARLHGIVHSPKADDHMMSRNGFPMPVNPHEGLYQIYLGQQDGKYGYLPVRMGYPKSDRLQKRMDNPTFFHGLLGNNNKNMNMQPKVPVYPVTYY